MITFITDNGQIEHALTELGAVKYPVTNPREHLHYRLSTQPYLCRDSDRYKFILLDLMDSLQTAVFIDSGTEIIGLVNFSVYDEEHAMIIESICTPYSKGTGTQLINVLKSLGMLLRLKELVVLSLPTARPFYIKNGLIEKDGNLLGYTFEYPEYYNIPQGHTTRSKSTRSKSKTKGTAKPKGSAKTKGKRNL